MRQEFGEQITGIVLVSDFEHKHDAECNVFSNTMVGQGIVSFVECRMWDGARGDEILVVAK
jgi:hypothetical protein